MGCCAIEPERPLITEAHPGIPRFELVSIHTWSAVNRWLRDVPIQCDVKARPNEPGTWRRPYKEATINLEYKSLAWIMKHARPTALYTLSGRLPLMDAYLGVVLYRHNIDLFKPTLEQVAIDVLNEHLIGYAGPDDDGVRRTMPPLIEVSVRNNEGPLVIDGLHRIIHKMHIAYQKATTTSQDLFDFARRAQNEKIGIIVLSNVKNDEQEGHTPLVPLPTNWKDIRFFVDDPIDDAQKRRYAMDTTTNPWAYGLPRDVTDTPESRKAHRYDLFRHFVDMGGRRMVDTQYARRLSQVPPGDKQEGSKTLGSP